MVFTSQVHAASDEYACYSSIVRYTNGPFYDDLSGNIGYAAVLFQGQLSDPFSAPMRINMSVNDQGLYLLLENASCFYRFGTATQTGGGAYFPMQVSVPEQPPTYLIYQSVPGEYPGVTWSPKALPGVNYANTSCEAATSPPAIGAIQSFLRQKIIAAPDRYKFDLHNCDLGQTCHSKREYIKALQSCPVGSLKPDIDETVKVLMKMKECRCSAPAN